jgi:hypothetical protein
MPRRFGLFSGLPLKRRENSCGWHQQHFDERRELAARPHSGSALCAVLLPFHGQTSWQMSQPKSQSPNFGASSCGGRSRFSIV